MVVGFEVIFDRLRELFGKEAVFFGVAADIDLEAEFDWFGGGFFDEGKDFFAVDGLDDFDEREDFGDFVGLERADEVAAVVWEMGEIGFKVGPAIFGEVADLGVAGEHLFYFFGRSVFDDGTNLHR